MRKKSSRMKKPRPKPGMGWEEEKGGEVYEDKELEAEYDGFSESGSEDVPDPSINLELLLETVLTTSSPSVDGSERLLNHELRRQTSHDMQISRGDIPSPNEKAKAESIKNYKLRQTTGLTVAPIPPMSEWVKLNNILHKYGLFITRSLRYPKILVEEDITLYVQFLGIYGFPDKELDDYIQKYYRGRNPKLTSYLAPIVSSEITQATRNALESRMPPALIPRILSQDQPNLAGVEYDPDVLELGPSFNIEKNPNPYDIRPQDVNLGDGLWFSLNGDGPLIGAFLRRFYSMHSDEKRFIMEWLKTKWYERYGG
jgi:hypothetical protein